LGLSRIRSIDPPLPISRSAKGLVWNVDSGKRSWRNSPYKGCSQHRFGAGRETWLSIPRSGSVTVLDLKTLKVIGQAQAGNNPDAIAYNPSTRRVFAGNADSADATVIDAKMGGTVPLTGKARICGRRSRWPRLRQH
jgi:DNA-binding beta-propeller fold protein YncE